MPPIHPDWLASSDQSAAISFRVAAKVIKAARLATRPNDNKIVALVDPLRPGACSNTCASAIAHLLVHDQMPSQVAYESSTRSPETDSVADTFAGNGLRPPGRAASKRGSRCSIMRSARRRGCAAIRPMTDGSLPESEPRGSIVGLSARFALLFREMSASSLPRLPPKQPDFVRVFAADRRPLRSVQHGAGAVPPWSVPLG